VGEGAHARYRQRSTHLARLAASKHDAGHIRCVGVVNSPERFVCLVLGSVFVTDAAVACVIEASAHRIVVVQAGASSDPVYHDIDRSGCHQSG
jgi:hypothetical protein